MKESSRSGVVKYRQGIFTRRTGMERIVTSRTSSERIFTRRTSKERILSSRTSSEGIFTRRTSNE